MGIGRLSRLEQVHTLLSLMILSGAFLGLYVESDFQLAAARQGSSVAKALWLAIYVPAILLSFQNPRRTVATFFTRAPFILGIVLLVLLSNLWSVLPTVTLRRSLHFLVNYQFACYLAARYSWEDFFDLVRWALRLGLLLSLVYTILRPSLGLHHGVHDGLWRGLFLHKNHLGKTGALCLCVSLACYWAKLEGSKRYLGFDLCLGILALGLAYSRTAIAVAVGTLLLSQVLRVWVASSTSLRLLWVSGGLLGTVLVLPMMALGFDLLTGFNLDRVLSGRLSLWKTVAYFVSQRPWTGYGYSVFFQEQAFGRLILLFEGWPVPHAHNAVLELTADLGLLAVPLYLGAVGHLLWSGLRLRGHASHLPLAVLSFNVLSGATETACFPDIELVSLMFMVVALSISRRTKRLTELPVQA